jgi:adenylate cyclase
MAGQPTVEEVWRAFLSGEHPELRRGRHLHRLLPSGPRCKMCHAPFGPPGALLMRLRGRGPSNLNPRLCNV